MALVQSDKLALCVLLYLGEVKDFILKRAEKDFQSEDGGNLFLESAYFLKHLMDNLEDSSLIEIYMTLNGIVDKVDTALEKNMKSCQRWGRVNGISEVINNVIGWGFGSPINLLVSAGNKAVEEKLDTERMTDEELQLKLRKIKDKYNLGNILF